jgi:hypothetical protein
MAFLLSQEACRQLLDILMETYTELGQHSGNL